MKPSVDITTTQWKGAARAGCLPFVRIALGMLFSLATFGLTMFGVPPRLHAAVLLTETFANDPVINGRATLDGNGSRFTFGPTGLTAHYDSLLSTARMTWSLGQALNDATDFQFSTRFNIASAGYFADPNFSAQIAFGLQNSATTGPDRVGNDEALVKAFDIATVDYFPNVSPTFGGPSLMPTVVKSETAAGYFGSILFPRRAESKLSDAGESPLPLNQFLTATLTYQASARVMKIKILGPTENLPINLVGGNSGVIGGPDSDTTTIQLTVPSGAAFSVDQFAIMLWQDTSNTTSSSVTANVTFDNLSVSNSLGGGLSSGSGTWTNATGDHKWTTNGGAGTNWDIGFPSAAGQTATFTSAGLAATPAAIDLDGDKTIGKLSLGTNSGGYTVGLSNTANQLFLDNSGGVGDAAITATAGSHSVNARVATTAASNLIVSVQTGGSLNLTQGIDNLTIPKTVSLSQSGSGTLTTGGISNGGTLAVASGSMVTTGNISGSAGTTTVGDNGVLNVGTTGVPSRIVQNGLTINGSNGSPNALVKISAGPASPIGGPSNTRNDSQVSRLSSLMISSSAGTTYPAAGPTKAYYGTLDLTNNSLFIPYGNNPGDDQIAYNAIEDMVRSGFNGGDWLGKGITSSTAATSDPFLYGVHVYDNAIAGLADYTSLGTNTIVAKFGYNGDTNGDGSITADDYTVVDLALANSPLFYMSLMNGDTNHDGQVTADDYTYIDINILSDIANPGLSGGANAVPLPEPSTFVLGLLGLIGLLIARRRVTRKTAGPAFRLLKIPPHFSRNG